MAPLEVLVADLKLRQLRALQADVPSAFDGHAERLSHATISGMRILNELAGPRTRLRELVEVVTLAERDPRFEFLKAIPEGPILVMMRALALERSVFAQESRNVAQLALLMGVFTVMLDGLLDEAPSMLVPAREWLDAVMDPGRWQDGGRALDELHVPDHAITEIFCWLTRELIGRLTAQPGWRGDAAVREQFSRATREAYRSEVDSVSCRITDRALSLDRARQRILAKSTMPTWAGSLVPFCVHGWPDNVEPGRFAVLAQAIGAFGGWIDDVVDVTVDLQADRWSMVLLEISDAARQLGLVTDDADPCPAIVGALGAGFIRERLAFAGVYRLRTVCSAFESAGLDAAPLLPWLADVAEVCLTTGLPVAAHPYG